MTYECPKLREDRPVRRFLRWPETATVPGRARVGWTSSLPVAQPHTARPEAACTAAAVTPLHDRITPSVLSLQARSPAEDRRLASGSAQCGCEAKGQNHIQGLTCMVPAGPVLA